MDPLPSGVMGPLSFAALFLATFIGALVQAATGFGFAIVAAPVFLAILDATSAVPLLVLLHIVQTAMIVPAVWRAAPRPLLARLSIGALVGCPIGLLVFQALDLRTLKLTAGVLILAITALLIARDRRTPTAWSTGSRAAHGPAPVATGALAGAMTAILVMPGPPLMLYLMGRELAKEASRALSLSLFGLCYVLVALLFLVAGEYGAVHWLDVLSLTLAVVIGTLRGSQLSGRLSQGGFRTAIFALLIASGIGALWSAL